MLFPRFALPLLALTLVGAAPQERIDVVLSNFKFTPATIRLVHGRSYVLHLSSSGGHSFAAKGFFAAAGLSPADRARLKDGKIDLDGGESVDVHFTAPRPGTYSVRCTHFLHTSFGMSGQIIVG